MDQNTVTILNEKFENDKTGSEVLGITIIVDGKLKEVKELKEDVEGTVYCMEYSADGKH